MERSGERIPRLVLALAAGALVALSSVAAEAQLEPIVRVVGYNFRLAGHDLNGVSLNGAILDGQRVQSVSTSDVALDGDLMEAVWLRRSFLLGVDGDGRYVPRRRMAGAVMAATLEDGEQIALRIDHVRRDTEPGNRDVWLYDVSYESDDGWQPLCGENELGEPIGAIPLAGTWDLSEGTETGGAHQSDESEITFACRGYVLAKCVEAGYKPWKRTFEWIPGEGVHFGDLSAHHQACTRMMRADFCGDGTPHTVDGSPVNLYDGLDVRRDSEPWAIEAEWDEDGAICAVRERIPGDCPDCMEWLVDDTCGDPSHFDDGVLLMSETELLVE